MTSTALKDVCRRVETALGASSAYRKIEDGLYVLKQGSTMVMINVHPWGENRAVVRLAAQLVKGVNMEVPLALELLELNGVLRFGSFAFQPTGEVILFVHTLLDRDVADAEEFRKTIGDFVVVADDYDDRIAARYGGQTIQDILEENLVEQMRRARAKAGEVP